MIFPEIFKPEKRSDNPLRTYCAEGPELGEWNCPHAKIVPCQNISSGVEYTVFCTCGRNKKVGFLAPYISMEVKVPNDCPLKK